MVAVNKILDNGRSLVLAYDHGMEHGPTDFNTRSIEPQSILDLALEGDYQGVIMHAGIAENYYHGPYKDVPLIVKLNGKTNIPHINPISRQICSVDRAIKIGASAVGYTIYDGSPAETVMFQEFGKVVEKAHDYGLPVVAWMYPRGPDVHDETSTDTIAYSARVALELGADFVKLKYNNDPHGFPWIVKCAGRCRVLLSGGERRDDRKMLDAVKVAVDSGAAGVAVGRNVWQHPKPFSMTKALKDIIFNKKSVDEAIQNFQ